MEEPLDTSQPIDVYFQRIDDCLQFAADTESPFSAQQTLETVYYAVSASGLYNGSGKAWRKRNATPKHGLHLKNILQVSIMICVNNKTWTRCT